MSSASREKSLRFFFDLEDVVESVSLLGLVLVLALALALVVSGLVDFGLGLLVESEDETSSLKRLLKNSSLGGFSRIKFRTNCSVFIQLYKLGFFFGEGTGGWWLMVASGNKQNL